jgi:hypothetical protein
MYSNFVIAIDIEKTKTFYAKNNAQIYQVCEKIDFMTADFFKVKQLNGDVVFLDPCVYKYTPNGKPFSIKDNLRPDLTRLLAKSLEISTCIAIKLPKDTELD